MLTGIYGIRVATPEGGLWYVGQTKNFAHRKAVHLYDLRRGKHYNPGFQAAYARWGEERFSFCWLDICPVERLDQQERYWIQQLQTEKSERGFNRDCGGALRRVPSVETRAKISEGCRKAWAKRIRRPERLNDSVIC